MTDKSGPNNRLKTLIIAGVALVALVICIVPCALYWPILTSPAPVLTIFSRESVEIICQTFSVRRDDEFCSHSVTSNAETLEEMLRRRFVEGTSNYDEVMRPFETILLSKPQGDPRTLLEECREMSLAVCTPVAERETVFSCTLYFSSEIPIIRLFFEHSTGELLDINVHRPTRT